MYVSETDKIRPRIAKYLNGRIMDIGCGNDKVTPRAFGVEYRDLPGVDFQPDNYEDIYRLAWVLPEQVGAYDVVYSSHCLEHIPNDLAAIESWVKMLRIDGVLILYLPDDRYYRENITNTEHFHAYVWEIFERRFKAYFGDRLPIIETNLHVGHDRYSFYVVAQKKVEI